MARLLNALLHMFRRSRVDEPPQDGPPAHWLKLREQGPPPHWLEVARRAGPTTGTADETGQPPMPPQTSQNEATSGDHSHLAEIPPVPESPAPNRTRSQADAPHEEIQKAGASDQPTFAARTKSPAPPLVWPPKREGHDRDRTVSFSERSKRTTQSESVIETPLAPAPVQPHHAATRPGSEVPRVTAEETRGNFIVHFLRRFKKANQSIPQIQRAQTPGPGGTEILQKRNEADSGLPRPSAISTGWPQTSENSRLAPIIFPESSRHPARSPFRNSAPTPATFSKGSLPAGQETDIAVPKRSVSRVEVPISPTRLREAGSRQNHETRQKPVPLRWGTLPTLGQETTTKFADQSVSQGREQTTYGGSEPNWWPDLIPDDPTFKETNWRSLMRRIQRSQRLEKEQRGY